MSRHELRENAHGRTVAGALFWQRVLRRRLRAELPELSRDKIARVLEAYGDLLWEVLLSGAEARIGAVGRIKLTIREPWIQMDPRTGGEIHVPQQPLLTGKLSPAFKAAIYDLEGVRYPEPLELEDDDDEDDGYRP